MRTRWVWIAPLAILGMLLFVFVGGEVVKLLWNWLLPTLFNWPRINFWQALGLLALCRILFGGLGMHGSGRSRRTPEERERIRQGIRKHFGFAQGSAQGASPSSGNLGSVEIPSP